MIFFIYGRRRETMEKTNDFMKTGKIFPLLMSMSVPMMLSMLIQSLYNIVDSIYVSRLGTDALTAVFACVSASERGDIGCGGNRCGNQFRHCDSSGSGKAGKGQSSGNDRDCTDGSSLHFVCDSGTSGDQARSLRCLRRMKRCGSGVRLYLYCAVPVLWMPVADCL